MKTAHKLIGKSSPRYVHLAATPDFSRRIFRTGIWSPFWGNCPPDEVHNIDAQDITAQALNSLLGCRITLSGSVDMGNVRTVWWQEHDKLKEPIAVSLAPINGTDERIWIKSQVVSGMGAEINPWHTQQIFTGVLATYNQALSALPNGLSSKARQVLPALPDAFVICPATPYGGKSLDYFTNHYWVPVLGSDNIFLWTSEDAGSAYDGTIAGVLEPLALNDYKTRDRCFAHFSTVTGQALPDRIGIIEYPNAEAYNKKLSGYAGIFTIFGILWTVCGLTGIILYIVAPSLISAAWEQALEKLSIWPTRGENKAHIHKPPTERSGSEPSLAAERTVERIYHPLMTPFSGLEPIPEELPPPKEMGVVFRTLRTFTPEKEDCYLSFVQDFMHHANPNSALCMIGCHDTMTAAEATLLNSGQRHPGLAMQLLSVNGAPLTAANELRPLSMDAFDMWAHDYVVLCHAPVLRMVQRVIVCAVYGGSEVDGFEKAERFLTSQSSFALMGRIFLIGDSENGPCQRMKKVPGTSIFQRAEYHLR